VPEEKKINKNAQIKDKDKTKSQSHSALDSIAGDINVGGR